MNPTYIIGTITAALLLAAILIVFDSMNRPRPRLVRSMFPFGTRVEHPVYGCGTVAGEERRDGMVLVCFDGPHDHAQLVARWTLQRAAPGKATPFPKAL